MAVGLPDRETSSTTLHVHVAFLDDGRVELDNNTVTRSMRPLALPRKNALFAGFDAGASYWAVVASLIETCKLNDVDPQADLTDVITRIVRAHPNRDIDELMPWRFKHAKAELAAVAYGRRLRRSALTTASCPAARGRLGRS